MFRRTQNSPAGDLCWFISYWLLEVKARVSEKIDLIKHENVNFTVGLRRDSVLAVIETTNIGAWKEEI